MTRILPFYGIIASTLLLVHQADAFIGALRSRAKDNLINLVTSGAPDNKVLSALEGVERLSLGSATLSNPLLPGNWLMVWTTSESIAGKSRPAYLQTNTPPEQLIDTENGRALNAEKVLGIRNSVEAELTPATRNKVKVQFKKFKVGPAGFAAPEGLKGELSVTYLDDEMRISRGDQGNVFILVRESNKRREADKIWREWRKSW
mmetsp:Transcript_27538/g.61176  ORF Transcript_27538/g.61176 Transcript_27538/m.61176 type:complete len:204 (-) Transcript_27538:28-639(-)